MILVGADQSILWANEAALRMHGAEQAEDLGATVDEYRERYQLRYRNNHRLEKGDYPFDRIIAGEAFSEVVVEVIPAGDEEPRWIHQIRSLIIADEAGVPDLLVLIMQDVSLRIEAEERFEQTFHVNPAPALILRLPPKTESGLHLWRNSDFFNGIRPRSGRSAGSGATPKPAARSLSLTREGGDLH